MEIVSKYEEKPLVTIAIITYEQPTLFFEALDSALNQITHKFDLIIVDDCSTSFKFSEDIVLKYINENNSSNLRKIIIRINDQNLGLVRSSNIALDLMQTKYCLFVDGDDLLPVNALDSLISYATSGNYDLVGGHHLIFNNSIESKIQIRDPDITKQNIEMLNNIDGIERFRGVMLKKLHAPSIVSSLILVTKIRQVGGFDLKFRQYHDGPLMQKLLLTDCTFGFIEEIVYYWRPGIGMTSNPYHPAKATFMKDYITLYEELNKDEVLRKGLNCKKMIEKHKIAYLYMINTSLHSRLRFYLMNFHKIIRYFILDKLIRYIGNINRNYISEK